MLRTILVIFGIVFTLGVPNAFAVETITFNPGARNNAATCGYTSWNPCAQKFIPSNTYANVSATTTLNFSTDYPSSMSGDMTVEVQSDSGGYPSGTLVSGTAVMVSAAALTTTPTNYSVAVPNLSVTASSTYWLVIKRTILSDNKWMYVSLNTSVYTFGRNNGTWSGGDWSQGAAVGSIVFPSIEPAPSTSTSTATSTPLLVTDFEWIVLGLLCLFLIVFIATLTFLLIVS